MLDVDKLTSGPILKVSVFSLSRVFTQKRRQVVPSGYEEDQHLLYPHW